MSNTKKGIPAEYQPLSPWAYFGYNILYSIPIIGWFFMIVFAIDSTNINRRNFTRSFFVIYVILAVLFIILLTTGLLLDLVSAIVGEK